MAPYDENADASAGMFNYRQQEQDPSAPDIKTYQKDGERRATVDIGYQQLQRILQALQVHGQAVQSMQQRADFLSQQEQRTRHNPILNVLAQISGNLAAGDKRLPPIVQALGRTSLQLNPGANQLAQERMQLEDRLATQTEADLRTLTAERRAQQQWEFQLNQAEHQRRVEVGRAVGDVVTRAQQTRQYTDDQAKADQTAMKEMFPWLKDEEVKAITDRAKGIAAAAELKYQQDIRTKTDDEIRQANLRARNEREKQKAMTERALAVADKRYQNEAMRDAEKFNLKMKELGMKVPPQAAQALVGHQVITKNIASIRDLMEKFPDKIGPGMGVLTKAGSYFDTEDSDITSSFEHLFAQLAKNYGGARGFAKVEQPIFRNLAGGIYRTKEANEGVLQQIEAWVAANQAAWRMALPQAAASGQFGDLFGPDPNDPAGITKK